MPLDVLCMIFNLVNNDYIGGRLGLVDKHHATLLAARSTQLETDFITQHVTPEREGDWVWIQSDDSIHETISEICQSPNKFDVKFVFYHPPHRYTLLPNKLIRGGMFLATSHASYC